VRNVPDVSGGNPCGAGSRKKLKFGNHPAKNGIKKFSAGGGKQKRRGRVLGFLRRREGGGGGGKRVPPLKGFEGDVCSENRGRAGWGIFLGKNWGGETIGNNKRKKKAVRGNELEGNFKEKKNYLDFHPEEKVRICFLGKEENSSAKR